MERNYFEMGEFCIAPVTDFSIFAGVSSFSGDADIDDFILRDAERHYLRRMAVTYVMKPISMDLILAFATLQNDSVKLGESSSGFRYKSSPAVKIGRIGVLSKIQSHGVGSFFISMIVELMRHDNRTGCRYITLDAYNTDSIINFYTKNGFLILDKALSNRNKRTVLMYRDLETV